VSIAMKAPAQHRRALEAAEKLAKKAGRAPSQRELDRATGKAVAPTKRALRALIAKLEKNPAGNAPASGFLTGLRYALSGGELPCYVKPDALTKPPKRKADDLAQSLADEAHRAIDEAVLAHGLTDKATKVWSASTDDGETICARLEAAGHGLAPEDVSKACARLARAGRAEKRPHGYRMTKESAP